MTIFFDMRVKNAANTYRICEAFGNAERKMRVSKPDSSLNGLVRVKKYHSYKGEIGKIAPNIIERNFNAEAPNQKWTTDITEFESMDEFKLELEKYIDYFNNKRIKCKLKGLSPVQYRIQSSLVA